LFRDPRAVSFDVGLAMAGVRPDHAHRWRGSGTGARRRSPRPRSRRSWGRPR
jgi:hypothetical protein